MRSSERNSQRCFYPVESVNWTDATFLRDDEASSYNLPVPLKDKDGGVYTIQRERQIREEMKRTWKEQNNNILATHGEAATAYGEYIV